MARMVDCCYALEDYSALEEVLDVLQPDDPLLKSMGVMFASVGMGKQARTTFTPNGQ
jgi:hypothetical protein